jgi:NTE family protein
MEGFWLCLEHCKGEIGGYLMKDSNKILFANVLKDIQEKALKEINLHNYELTDNDIKPLVSAIANNKFVISINLRKNRINDSGAQALAEVLKNNTSITYFDLRDNRIGSKGGEALVQAIRSNSTILSLEVDEKVGRKNLASLENETNKNKIQNNPDSSKQIVPSEGNFTLVKAVPKQNFIKSTFKIITISTKLIFNIFRNNNNKTQEEIRVMFEELKQLVYPISKVSSPLPVPVPRIEHSTPSSNSTIFRNLIFKGGGVKGIAYVGALKALIQHKGFSVPLSQIERVAGTSAGALVTLLIALGYQIDQIESMLWEIPFEEFLDSNDKDNLLKLKQNFDKKNYTTLAFDAIFNSDILKKLKGQQGYFKAEGLREWIDTLVWRATGKKNATFADVHNLRSKYPYLKDMWIVATDVTDGTSKEKIFSYEDEDANTPIADAVRASMAFPLIFVPWKINGRIYSDGGLVDNFPLCIFDKYKYRSKLSRSKPNTYPVINMETLGFYLKVPKNTKRERMNWSLRIFLLALFDSFCNFQEKGPDDDDRVVYINAFNVNSYDFDLNDNMKTALICSGEGATREFLDKLRPHLLKYPRWYFDAEEIVVLMRYSKNSDFKVFPFEKLTLDEFDKTNPNFIYDVYSLWRANLINYLKSISVDINTTNESGATALHIAAREGNQACLEKLINDQANIEIKDKNNATPLDVAMLFNKPHIVAALIKCGALDCSNPKEVINICNLVIGRHLRANKNKNELNIPLKAFTQHHNLAIDKNLKGISGKTTSAVVEPKNTQPNTIRNNLHDSSKAEAHSPMKKPSTVASSFEFWRQKAEDEAQKLNTASEQYIFRSSPLKCAKNILKNDKKVDVIFSRFEDAKVFQNQLTDMGFHNSYTRKTGENSNNNNSENHIITLTVNEYERYQALLQDENVELGALRYRVGIQPPLINFLN